MKLIQQNIKHVTNTSSYTLLNIICHCKDIILRFHFIENVLPGYLYVRNIYKTHTKQFCITIFIDSFLIRISFNFKLLGKGGVHA